MTDISDVTHDQNVVINDENWKDRFHLLQNNTIHLKLENVMPVTL